MWVTPHFPNTKKFRKKIAENFLEAGSAITIDNKILQNSEEQIK